MNESGQGPLEPFALYLLRPTWVGGQPEPANRTDAAWEGLGLRDVPITALRDGFVIFEFDKSADYAGGAVPAYTLPEDRRIPQHVTKADAERVDLAYRRFIYMNAFLLALYSGFSTVQKTAKPVQEPADPTNYFGAERTANGWQPFMDLGGQIEYPRQRSDNIELETLDHSLEILQKFDTTIGPASLDVLALTYTACHHYSRHQFSSAHLIAWAAIEALLNVMWLNMQDQVDVSSGGHTKINKERKRLLAGRDYPAAVVSQILSIREMIDDDTLNRLDEARRKRNEFAHALSLVKADDAGKALRLATDMITKIAGIRVTSQLGLHFWL
jgi:hypothetical protein